MLYIVSTVALNVEQILKKGQLNKHIVLKHNILEIGCRYRELPGVQVSFRKGRGTRDQIVNISWTMEKAREFQKNIYFSFIDNAKAFDCVDQNKQRKILKEMGIPDHLICLLRNLYAGQEATVKTGHGTTDWFQIGKKKYAKAVYCHLAYLTYMHSPS